MGCTIPLNAMLSGIDGNHGGWRLGPCGDIHVFTAASVGAGLRSQEAVKNKLIGVLVLAGVLVGCNSGKAQKLPPDAQPIGSLDGSVLYKAYCASCHGTDARGGGPMAKSLKVPPPDLTRVSIRTGGTFPLKRIGRIISGDEQPPGGHGTPEMPVWGPFFSRVENDQDLGLMRIDALARYLEQIQRRK
jgi:mono/diheme cytochrome c family protein